MSDPSLTLTTQCIEKTLTMVRATPCGQSAYCPDEESSVRFSLHVIAEKALTELLESRTARAADVERVRSVVRDAALALLTERKLYVVKPQQPTIGEIALEAYGHGRACDAAALLGDELQALLDAIAARAAEQLAGAEVGLSETERCHLLSVRILLKERNLAHGDLWVAEIATIDRLIASPPVLCGCGAESYPHRPLVGCHPAPDHTAAICALLDSDMPAGDLRKAMAELVGRR